MKRLVLHVGDHKTGTSTIQRALAAGAAGGRVLYPAAGRADGAGHHNLAWQIGVGEKFRPKKGGWTELAREIAASEATTIVVSSEAFEFKSPSKIISLIDESVGHQLSAVDVVVYLRPHASRILASFAERLKRGIGPFELDAWIDAAISSRRFYYAPRIKAWRDAAARVGGAPVSVDVRVFDRRQLMGADVLTDFLEGPLSVSEWSYEAPDGNQSPSRTALRLMQIHGEAMMQAGGTSLARRTARKVANAASNLEDDDLRPLTLSRIQAERIAEAFASDAEATDALIPSARSGRLFASAFADDVARADASPPRDFGPATEAALRASATIAAALAKTTVRNKPTGRRTQAQCTHSNDAIKGDGRDLSETR